MNLYELTKQEIEVLQIVEENNGLITQEQLEILNNIKNKYDNYYYYIKSLESQINMLKEEKQRVQSMINSKENTITNLKRLIIDSLKMKGETKVDTDKIKIRLQKSYSVNVYHDSIVDEKYSKMYTEYKIDKSLLLKDLKAGIGVRGAKLVESEFIKFF